MLTSAGDISDKRDQLKLIISDLPELNDDLTCSSYESSHIASLLASTSLVREEEETMEPLTCTASSTATTDPVALHHRLLTRATDGKFAMAAGAMTPHL